MQDEKLTLEKAVKEAKSSELIKQHHEILKGDNEDRKIDRVRSNKQSGLKVADKTKSKLKDSENPDLLSSTKTRKCCDFMPCEQ